MYTEMAPDNSSSGWIEAIWFSKSDGQISDILPDNCSDIIIDLNRSGAVHFVGNMTRQMAHHPVDDEYLLGIRLKPACSAAFLRESAASLTDRKVELSAIVKHSFHETAEQYQETGTIPLESVIAHVASLCAGFRMDRHIAESIAILKKASGQIRIDELARDVGISRRMLEKKFRYYLGKSPKRFAQIERFNAVLSGRIDFQQSNYYDQSHMAREFKMLAGSLVR
jgi:AraC-like DNA-binding protein